MALGSAKKTNLCYRLCRFHGVYRVHRVPCREVYRVIYRVYGVDRIFSGFGGCPPNILAALNIGFIVPLS